jgi:hypothetical protein
MSEIIYQVMLQKSVITSIAILQILETIYRRNLRTVTLECVRVMQMNFGNIATTQLIKACLYGR